MLGTWGGIVANRHFGKLADVWKHLALCEVLAHERPSVYAETHAGSAAYALIDDAERRYGVQRFRSVSAHDPVLADSHYAGHLDRVLGGGDHRAAGHGALRDVRLVPGSPLLAMLELTASARYVLCDTDPRSTDDLRSWAARMGLADRVVAVTGDGMAAVAEQVLDSVGSPSAASTIVHVDPYDPAAREPGSVSALEVTARLIDAGAGVVYWYGFDAPAARGWALQALHEATGAALWCGDMLVTSADGTVRDDGDLGRATAPGTGFGIVLASVTPAARDRCRALGDALARAYDGAPLPDGRAAILDFRSDATTSA